MHRTISILGCGWLGMELGKNLRQKDYRVYGSTGTPERVYELASAEIQPFYLNVEPGSVRIGSRLFFNSEVLVISIPPSPDENVETIFPGQIFEIIQLVKHFQIRKVLFISCVSVYQETNREVFEGEEDLPFQPIGRALLKAEKLLMAEKSFQSTIVRFGGLIGPGRNPAWLITGQRNIPGNVPVNLIHLDDGVNILNEIIEKNIWGTVFNACCPEHPSGKEFYSVAAGISGLPAPEFTDRQENFKIVNSDKLQQQLGYSFRYANPLDYLAKLAPLRKSSISK
jgi:nucleoside-diphosphate-sugar epimerase